MPPNTMDPNCFWKPPGLDYSLLIPQNKEKYSHSRVDWEDKLLLVYVIPSPLLK